MFIRIFWTVVCTFLLSAQCAAEPELLEPAKAFRFSARLLAADQVEVRFDIAPGYYMYREKFKFSAEPASVSVDATQLPAGKIKKDEFFGDVQIYRGSVNLLLPVKRADGAPIPFVLKAVSQGCADVGVCYPPQEQQAELRQVALSSPAAAPAGAAVAEFVRAAPAAAGVADTPGSDDARIAALFKGDLWVLISFFFGAGLLLSLTPCVFPMIPILSGILVPHGEHLTHARGFALSLAYVLGMAITYAAAGVAAGLLGTMLSAALQTPWVLGAFAAMFVVLSLSMFGFYELQLPSALQSRLAVTSNRLHGGHFVSVFGMGVLSALIVGPCVAAPLAGALLYISKSGDYILGGAALFALALGMGVPLLVVGASAGTLLPKAGPWMETVKRFFGVVLLGVAIFLISPLLPPMAHLLAWAVLLIMFAVYLHALDPLPHGAPGYRRLFKGVGIVALVTGIALIVGALSGGRDVLQPLGGLRSAGVTAAAPVHFQRVNSLAELDQAIAAAAGKPVMLDFYADWCVSCKEMERDTFSAAVVQSKMQQMVILQADVTDNLDAHKALLKRFDLFGPPGIVFFDRRGDEINGLRVVGFQAAARFATVLDSVLR
jgi:thiol:disulfide interchange protein DsbD